MFFLPHTSNAVPASLDPITVEQPDGSYFTIRQFGDEWSHHAETLDGYTVAQDGSGWWSYATLDSGSLKASGNRVGKSNPSQLGLKKRLKPEAQAVPHPAGPAGYQGAPPTIPGKQESPPLDHENVSGTMQVLAIPVYFSDVDYVHAPNSTHSGTKEWFSNNKTSTNATLSMNINASNLSSLTLSFWTWYRTDSSDIGYVEASVNNGSTWAILANYSGYQSDWTQKSLNLSAYVGNSSVTVRFRLSTNIVAFETGWFLDDIAVPETGFSDDVESGTGTWSNSSWFLVTASWHPATLDAAYFNNILFNTTNGSNSMYNYYKEVSYGKVLLNGTVLNWVRSNHTMDYYGSDQCGPRDSGHSGACVDIYELTREAVQLANPYVNFSQYDADHDGVVDHLIIIHAGWPQESTGVTNDIWSHRWAIASPGELADGVHVSGYTMVSERSRMGTFAHEFGHDIGLPDLYDTDLSSFGIGYWDLMAYGEQLTTPAHLSAWSKYYLGWVSPVEINATVNNLTWSVQQAETSNSSIFKLLADGANYQEYFLVENREQTGFDRYLPDSGLLIWHVDEQAIGNDNDSHRMVSLEEADGNDQAMQFGDAWYNNTDGFNATSEPNSTLYSGYVSNTTVTNISGNGSVMTATFSVGTAAPTPPVMNNPSPAVTRTSATISWQDSVSADTDYYDVYRGSSTINSSTLNASTKIGSGLTNNSLTDTPPSDGIWYYAARGTDYLGSIGEPSSNKQVTKDTVQPTITWFSPVNLGTYNQSVLVNVSADENCSEMERQIDSGSYTVVCTNCSNYSAYYNFSSDAYHTVNMAAWDMAGNNLGQTKTIYIDMYYPSLINWTPSSGSYISGSSSQAFSAYYNESRVDFVAVMWKNASESSYAQTNGTNCFSGSLKDCSASVNLSGQGEGNISYYFLISDLSGKGNQSSVRNVTIDRSSPSVLPAGQTPANGSRQTSNSVAINVSVSDASMSACVLQWNGANESMTLSGGYCYKAKSTTDGTAYAYMVYANDTVGNVNSTGLISFRENAKPNGSASIAASTYYTNDNLTCGNGTVTDAENDAVTLAYDWHNGTSWIGLNSQTLPNNYTSKGQSWKCSIVLNDSYESSNYTSNSVTIQDSAPVISPISNVTINETGTAFVSVSATDADNDSLTVTFSSKLNSSGQWTTGPDDSGTYIINASVSDGQQTSYMNFTITVLNIPVLDQPENVSTNMNNLSVSVDNSTYDNVTILSGQKTVEFKEGNATVLEFSFNFSSLTLNFSNVTLQREDNSSPKGSVLIRGISGVNKTAYVDKIAGYSYVCVKDAEVSNISEVSSACNGMGERIIRCNSTLIFGYNCSDIGSAYKVSGLSHSAVTEQQPYCGDGYCNAAETCSSCSTDCGSCPVAPPSDTGAPSGGGGGGGGGGGPPASSCNESWSCSEWSSCASGIQSRSCSDTAKCNTTKSRPSISQNCTASKGEQGAAPGQTSCSTGALSCANSTLSECVNGTWMEKDKCPSGCDGNACAAEGAATPDKAGQVPQDVFQPGPIAIVLAIIVTAAMIAFVLVRKKGKG